MIMIGNVMQSNGVIQVIEHRDAARLSVLPRPVIGAFAAPGPLPVPGERTFFDRYLLTSR